MLGPAPRRMRGNPFPSQIMKLTADKIAIGQDNYAGYSPRATADQKAYVLGVQFGPMLLVVTNSIEEAIDEWEWEQDMDMHEWASHRKAELTELGVF